MLESYEREMHPETLIKSSVLNDIFILPNMLKVRLDKEKRRILQCKWRMLQFFVRRMLQFFVFVNFLQFGAICLLQQEENFKSFS